MLFCTKMSRLAEPLAGTVTVSLAGRTTMLYEDCHMSLHQWASAASGAKQLAKTVTIRILVRMLMTPSGKVGAGSLVVWSNSHLAKAAKAS